MNLKIFGISCLFTNYCAEKERILMLEGKEKLKLKIKFYRCKHCGKILVLVEDSGVPTICCGEIMDELVPSSTDGTVEKHVPIITQNENVVLVRVGDLPHPMDKDHYIQWIVLMTDKGIQKKYLCPGEVPKAEFALIKGESIIGAYAYCNLHKLWKDN